MIQYAWVKENRRIVGWVEERNPTFSVVCWVSLRSTQPTQFIVVDANPSVLEDDKDS